MKRSKPVVAKRLVCLLFALMAVGCGGKVYDRDTSILSGWIGQKVRVQFRRDALGAAADVPIGPRVSSFNGATTAVSGKLLAVGPGSVLIDPAGVASPPGEPRPASEPCWIPREVILSVRRLR